MNVASGEVLLELYRGARQLPIPEFQSYAFGLLKKVLRFNSSMWGSGQVVPESGLVIHDIHLHNQPPEMLASYEEIKTEDVAAFEARKRIGEVCNIHFRELASGRRCAGAIAHTERFEMENLLVTTRFDQFTRSVGFMSLWRAKERDRYGEDDRRLADFLLPHFFEAGAMNRLLCLNRMDVIEKRGARAIAGMTGLLHTRDDEFIDLLKSEWPDWRPPKLPDRLVESLQRSRGRRMIGKRIAVSAEISGETLYLHARAKAVSGELTAAERAAAALIADGLSYKEAAIRLHVSPATVRNQLHSVYCKLGVRDKMGLAQHIGTT